MRMRMQGVLMCMNRLPLSAIHVHCAHGPPRPACGKDRGTGRKAFDFAGLGIERIGTPDMPASDGVAF